MQAKNVKKNERRETQEEQRLIANSFSLPENFIFLPKKNVLQATDK